MRNLVLITYLFIAAGCTRDSNLCSRAPEHVEEVKGDVLIRPVEAPVELLYANDNVVAAISSTSGAIEDGSDVVWEKNALLWYDHSNTRTMLLPVGLIQAAAVDGEDVLVVSSSNIRRYAPFQKQPLAEYPIFQAIVKNVIPLENNLLLSTPDEFILYDTSVSTATLRVRHNSGNITFADKASSDTKVWYIRDSDTVGSIDARLKPVENRLAQPVQSIAETTDTVYCAGFSRIFYFDKLSGKITDSLYTEGAGGSELDVSPDGNFAVIAADGYACFSLKEKRFLHWPRMTEKNCVDHVLSGAVDQASSKIFTGHLSGWIRISDAFISRY